MAQPDLNQFYPENGIPSIKGNNGFNKRMQIPLNTTVEEIACTQMDITTDKHTGKENIQYSNINLLPGKEANRESVQHIEPDKFKTHQINTHTNQLAGEETNRELVRHIKPDESQHNSNELNLRGHAINNTREQTINSMQNKTRNAKCIRLILTMNGVKVTAVLDTGSPISIMSKADMQRIKPLNYLPINNTTRYTDFNGNEVKLTGEMEVETIFSKRPLITSWMIMEGNREPIIGMNNIPNLGIELFSGGKPIRLNRINENPEELIEALTKSFNKLFKENHTVHDLQVKIELKPDHKPVQQKGRRIPIHLQPAVNREINKLINSGHLIRANDIQQTQFISPTVITVKKDNSVKIAMDARILNDNTIKRKAQMPNLEELLGQVSLSITKNENMPLYISTIDLEYAFGQISLHPDTGKHCNIAIIGREATGYYQFKK